MVHALKEAWRVLRPQGIMLDIRPQSVDVPLELVYEEEREAVGIVDMSPDLEYDVAADQAIGTVIKGGIFKEVNVEYFDYAYYWKTFHGMMVDFEERWKDEIIISKGVIDKAGLLYNEKRPNARFRLGMRMKLGKYQKQQ
ncbi:MAG: hypothetical protein WAV05_18160 [Anaerolineales bacterium]